MESISNNHEPAHPAKPVAPYIGGKQNLAARLVKRINAIEHTAYVEVFTGMGGVFLRRDRRPRVEVINDLNGEIANFFRIIQRHYTAFMEMMRFQVPTRVAFERLKNTDPCLLTDLERAARFLYLQRLAFGGKVTGQAFGAFVDRTRFDITQIAPLLEDLHVRMAGVVIECLPYQRLIESYDKPGTLFYLDPPYWRSENDYGKDLFDRSDFQRLADQLAKIDGGFILSLNDVPDVRNIFAAFHIEAIKTRYTIAPNSSKKAGELIISNRLTQSKSKLLQNKV
ncbi:MAG: DNA adenine methylase [Sphingomonadales bacterium]